MQAVTQIRALFNQYIIDAYIIPGTDPHQSEYLPELWKRREYVSGFSGSAGDLIVSRESAALWTDSRYFIQAALQLQGSGIELQKIGMPETPDFAGWLAAQLKPGQTVGVDPRLMNTGDFKHLKEALSTYNIRIQGVEDNLVDMVREPKVDYPLTDVRIQPLDVAGKSVVDKIIDLRAALKDNRASAHVIAALDAIAWLFNIRANDVDYNPYAIAYAIITVETAELFVHKAQISDEVISALDQAGVNIYPYDDFKSHLQNIAKTDQTIWLDPETTSHWIYQSIDNPDHIFFQQSPIVMAKAQKNAVELDGIRAAHIRDGVAMVRFLKWFEDTLGHEEITEISAEEKLAALRSEQERFAGLSFATISAYKEHGAIVHYESSPETDVPLKKEGIYLLDSGGQYFDGTTDLTRTLTLGGPTAEQKDRYTRVLKGHIAIATAQFPRGTTGPALDTLARKALWDIQENYGHGTGHGVGAYLGVHEGPQGISYYRGQGVPILEGMVTSNEPGYYKEGEYGIRIENLVITIKANEDASFLKFETITFCPIDKMLIDKSLMTDDEIAWFNDYHQLTYNKLAPFLNAEEKAWLKEATKEI